MVGLDSCHSQTEVTSTNHRLRLHQPITIRNATLAGVLCNLVLCEKSKRGGLFQGLEQASLYLFHSIYILSDKTSKANKGSPDPSSLGLFGISGFKCLFQNIFYVMEGLLSTGPTPSSFRFGSSEIFSKHRPSGPMLSISQNVRLSVCLSVRVCVCSLLRYHLTVFLPPLPKVRCPIFLEIRNPWGKVMERSGLGYEHFCLKIV